MKRLAYFLLSLSVLIVVAVIATGDYVYREGTKLSCSENITAKNNTPKEFYPNEKDRGPFRGDGWDKWVTTDLSDWWITETNYEKVKFKNADGSIEYSAWWIAPTIKENKDAIIIVHGYGASKHEYTVLMPAGMLVKKGHNVLVIDARDSGETTCEDGRHSAGQEEVFDILAAAEWLEKTHAVEINKVGVHGVSGGAIAALYALAKSPDIAAVSLHGVIFDFNKIARHEVMFQGFPGFLWSSALIAARLRGINLRDLEPYEGIDNLNGRPLQIFHEERDTRLPLWNMTDLQNYTLKIGEKADFYLLKGADHMEGLLLEPKFFEEKLYEFFENALR